MNVRDGSACNGQSAGKLTVLLSNISTFCSFDTIFHQPAPERGFGFKEAGIRPIIVGSTRTPPESGNPHFYMLYAKHDSQGQITALFDQPTDGAIQVSANSPDVLHFLELPEGNNSLLAFLQRSDMDLVRVVEDLIELLVDRNVILFTELPDAAQQKLLSRKQVRESLNDSGQLMVGKDDIL